jgi:DNA-3-methyladenine glycosylase
MHRELSVLKAKDAAARLIGCELMRIYENKILRGVIVETEAYDQTDTASHSFKGISPRNSVMFKGSGVAYVYFTYGLHYCMNVVVGKEGEGSAVLIRALEPLEGFDVMYELRKTNLKANLCSGPAKLAQALSIDRSLNGHDLDSEPLVLIMHPPVPAESLVWGRRIGIKEKPGEELMWRVGLKSSKFLSRPL